MSDCPVFEQFLFDLTGGDNSVAERSIQYLGSSLLTLISHEATLD